MGHCKEVSELLKIRFGLITFYQCFECCQRGFALLYSIQNSGKRDDLLMIHCHLHMGIIVALKPCLNLWLLRWFKARHNLVNSFKPYGL